MRFTGPFIIEVLLESGDLTAARRSLTDSLTWARKTGYLTAQVSFLRLTADLELRAGNLADASCHLREAIESADLNRLRRTCYSLSRKASKAA